MKGEWLLSISSNIRPTKHITFLCKTEIEVLFNIFIIGKLITNDLLKLFQVLWHVKNCISKLKAAEKGMPYLPPTGPFQRHNSTFWASSKIASFPFVNTLYSFVCSERVNIWLHSRLHKVEPSPTLHLYLPGNASVAWTRVGKPVKSWRIKIALAYTKWAHFPNPRKRHLNTAGTEMHLTGQHKSIQRREQKCRREH